MANYSSDPMKRIVFVKNANGQIVGTRTLKEMVVPKYSVANGVLPLNHVTQPRPTQSVSSATTRSCCGRNKGASASANKRKRMASK